ncbi:T9SS type A sorting domain-containing protein [candidate division WOR-3 bacterium]|nr:T9SS type A sorting domain-containing protein [candidate division WOR-3 bacterium]
MLILLMLPFLFGGFNQKWFIPRGISDGAAGRICICDTDRDGNFEFIFTTYGGSFTIYFYELHLPNTWEIDSFPYVNSPLLWDIGDFDLDGLWDIVFQASAGPPNMLISIAESPDSFSYPTQEVWRDTVGFAVVQPISAYDVDNDGFPEILDNNGNGQPNFFWIYEAVSNNQYDTVYTTNPDPTLLDGPVSTHAFGDFDSDGKMEFAMGGMSAGSLGATYWVYESPANNVYEQCVQGYVSTKSAKDCFSVPDADEDGKLEFVVKGFVIPSAEIHAFIFESIADNTYAIIKTFTLPGGDYYGGYSDAGDVDGDSIPEIVLEARQNVFIIKAAGNDSFYVWDTLPGHASGSCVRIFDIDGNGLSEIVISGNNETRIYEYDPGGIEETTLRLLPNALRLEVYPNPTRGNLRIRFNSPDEQKVTIKLYDVTGRLVNEIFNRKAKIGTNEMPIMAENYAAGIYFIRIKTDKEIITEKFIVLK